MTPAELKTTRESLGLTSLCISMITGKSLRTVQYWESAMSKRKVPADIPVLLSKIEKEIAAGAKELAEEVIRDKKCVNNETAILTRYKNNEDYWQLNPKLKGYPATTHAVMIQQTINILNSNDISTRTEYMDIAEYKSWLADRNDTEVLRLTWAGQL